MGRTISILAGLIILILGCSQSPWIFHRDLIERPGLGSLVVLAAVLFGWFGHADLARLWRQILHLTDKAYRSVAFGIGAATALIGTGLIFQAQPRLTDAMCNLYQARIFASGSLTQELAPIPAAFANFGLLDSEHGLPHVVSMYPPGWSAVLAFGCLVGLPWIVAPLLNGLNAVLTERLGTRLLGRDTGRAAGLLFAVSPMMVLLGSTYLAHTLTTTCILTATLGTLLLVRTGNWRFGLLAGAGMGLAFLTRQGTALMLGIAIATIPLGHMRNVRRWLPGALVAGVLAAGGVLLLFLWQDITYGHWRQSGHLLASGDQFQMGFHEFAWSWNNILDFTPAVALEQAAARVQSLGERLLGWPVNGFVLVCMPFFLNRAGRWQYWLLLPPLALTSFYTFFFYFEFFHPGRYLAETVPFLLILCACGLVGLGERLTGIWRRWIGILVLAGTACWMAIGVPTAMQFYNPVHGDYAPQPWDVVQKHNLKNALIFYVSPTVDLKGQPIKDKAAERVGHPIVAHYTSGPMIRNRLDRAGDIVFVKNLLHAYVYEQPRIKAKRDAAMMQGLRDNLRLASMYPGRNYYAMEFHRDSWEVSLVQLWTNEDFTEFVRTKTIQ